MAADTSLALDLQRGIQPIKLLVSSELSHQDHTSERTCQVSELLGSDLGLFDERSLTTVVSTAIWGQPLEGVSGMFGTMVGLEVYGLKFGQLLQSLTI